MRPDLISLICKPGKDSSDKMETRAGGKQMISATVKTYVWYSKQLTTAPVQAMVVQSLDNIIHQAQVVQRLDNAIHRINHYPADSVVYFFNTYPLDSDLSGG